MFCESYNTTHGGLDVFPKPKDDNNAYYNNGYSYQNGSGLKNTSQTELVSEINKNMYFKSNYWLSSPSAYSANGTNYVIDVESTGNLDYWFFSHTTQSFRPLVCLKSNVHLVEKTNGTTTTYELEVD